MTAIDSQNLVPIGSYIAETHLVAMIRQEPAEMIRNSRADFCRSYDDLDYLVFAVMPLPSGDRLSLIRHENSPAPGLEICVRHDCSNVVAVLQAAIAEMNLSIEDFTWIHPEYEQQLKDSFMRDSEIEANALTDPDNQPLTPESLKKVRRIKRK